MDHTDDGELLDTAPAARLLGIRPGTLEVWRYTGRYGLRFVKVGRRVKYRRSDLVAWLASRTACSTTAATATTPPPAKSRVLIRSGGRKA